MSKTQWALRADVLQNSLDDYFSAPQPQYLHNRYPHTKEDDALFNYWWLAHVIDCRLDAYQRSHDAHRLRQATQTHDNLIARNHGSLFNDYFDDMLWFALADLRLYEATSQRSYLQEVLRLWDHTIENGWNDILGPSLSWRKQQPYYKNTPANAPLSILGARLHRITGEQRYLDYSRAAFDWITDTLVRSDGFVGDGINRHQDLAKDDQWNFTYNQGTYIGAAIEIADCTNDPGLPQLAIRTAKVTLQELVRDGVFVVEGENGDEGLFKGIFYRYLGLLIDHLSPESHAMPELISFIVGSTDRMWEHARRNSDGALLLGNDWNAPSQGQQYYSTELSGIMAAELRSHVETD
ncbi:glycoside hydrolase family 76 protein [Bifidobacterium sp.]|uniref:glycoside hydrolase family 76 protein n=1 Tax=Bifidobacterium sp. TaxID=41200 RepID=UPI0039E752C3